MDAFVNKILFEPSLPSHLHIVCGCFCAITMQLSDFDKDHVIHKAKDVYFMVFLI